MVVFFFLWKSVFSAFFLKNMFFYFIMLAKAEFWNFLYQFLFHGTSLINLLQTGFPHFSKMHVSVYFLQTGSDVLDINCIGLQLMCTPYDLNVKLINTI